nr:MAG TPA: hypothetical protein [Caudoviricetes sp.]
MHYAQPIEPARINDVVHILSPLQMVNDIAKNVICSGKSFNAILNSVLCATDCLLARIALGRNRAKEIISNLIAEASILFREITQMSEKFVNSGFLGLLGLGRHIALGYSWGVHICSKSSVIHHFLSPFIHLIFVFFRVFSLHSSSTLLSISTFHEHVS